MKEPWSFNNLIEITEKFKDESIKVISFDMFNTLILRPYMDDDDIFEMLDKEYSKLSELEKRAQKIIDKRDIWQRRPLVLYDQRFDFTEVLKYQEKKELEKKNKPYCPIRFVANPNYKPDWLKKLEKEEES